MNTDESSSTMSEISADDDIKQYNADGSDTGTAVMYFWERSEQYFWLWNNIE